MSLSSVIDSFSCFVSENASFLFNKSSLKDETKPKASSIFHLAKDCAVLAEEVYNFDKNYARENINGYSRVKSYDTNNKKTGFQGCVFENDDSVIVAYRGTDGESLDMSDNARMYGCRCPAQYTDALALYSKVCQDKRFSGKTIYITGHSLGGSLAQLVASTPNIQLPEAITFNPFGRAEFIENSNGLFQDFGNCTNFVVENDMVGTMREHPGKVASFSVVDSSDVSASQYHSVNHFLNNEEKFKKACRSLESSKSLAKNQVSFKGETGIIVSCVEKVRDFLYNCGKVICSVFGFGSRVSTSPRKV